MAPAPEPRAKRRARPPFTVRARIVGVLTLAALVGMWVAGGTAYLVERDRKLSQIDPSLHAALESAAFTVARGSWTSDEAALRAVVQRIAPDDNSGSLGIVGGRAAFVPGIATDVQLERLPGFVERVVAETSNGQATIGTYVHGDTALRYLAAPVSVGSTGAEPRTVFVTGVDLRAELAELNRAAFVFTVSSVVVTALVALLGMLIAGRLLRPIREMRTMADRISAENLSERIPVVGRDDVSDMGATVNAMLDRLDAALASQRELLADVGHELRTPITIVRGHLELMDAADSADVAATRALAIDELDRMAGLVSDIRDAAKLRDPDAFRFRRVDVASLLEQIASKASAIGEDDVAVTTACEETAVLDPDRITQAMLQLVANAVAHATGPIELGARTRSGALELSVRDHGPGVEDSRKSAIFERFTRGTDEGRGSGGSGLGLAIVRLIAERHGGSVGVADADPGATFTIAIPLRRGEPPHSPDREEHP